MGGILNFAQRIVDTAWTVKNGSARTAQAAPARKRQFKTKSARNFAGGEVDLLTASFTGSTLSINEELKRSLARLQQRSRQLCMDNDYAKKFLHMVKANVVGSTGINLQCQFLNADGKFDTADNQTVEAEWKQWSKKRECGITGKLSWRDLQSLAIETIARDGEVLIEKITQSRSRFGIKLRVMECDHLDINHNVIFSNGNRIVMGVELDSYDAPVAYHLSENHPGDHLANGYTKRRRIPAAQILHLFITERPGQVRGIPWMHTAIRRLNMLGGYEEAELVAARIGASKMGFFTTADGEAPNATSMAPDSTDDGGEMDLVDQATPGTFETLPEGVGFETFDPQHPSSSYADFTREVLRGAASGLNVAYNTWANDLEGVNFSSIRSGVLEERDQWRVVQGWLADQLHDEIYQDWINWQVQIGTLKQLPSVKIDSKYLSVIWQSRGWEWVDPLKDVRAKSEEYELGTATLTEIARSKGKDLHDIFKQRRAELDLAEEYGLEVGKIVYHAQGLNPPASPNQEQDEDNAPANQKD
jgi:lambda family phage portal protein